MKGGNIVASLLAIEILCYWVVGKYIIMQWNGIKAFEWP